MTDLYFKYKQILEDENKKIISHEVTDDGFLILDVIDSCLNEYKYFVCEVDGVIGTMVFKKDYDYSIDISF